MSKADLEALIRLDLNNPVFQVTLLTLQKPERHAALETLNKLRQMTWNQAYRDNGLKWEKVLRMRLFIPSLRGAQRRGNPEGFVLADILDCFASLAMTKYE